MDAAILEAHRDLVEAVDAAGWDVTETELSVYQSPWIEGDDPEAQVTITARRPFPAGDDDRTDEFRLG